MDRNDSREIFKWHDAVLVPRFDLQAAFCYEDILLMAVRHRKPAMVN